MRSWFSWVRVAVILVLLSGILGAQTNVLTFHNDNAHTGQNLTETALTPANVNAGSFGKLLTFPVDGKVDAQPLYVHGLTIPNTGVHNVVFAATEHDSVYAFDAISGAAIWQVSLLKPGEMPSDPRNCTQVVPEIGITATPVIDLSAGSGGSIYVVAMSKDGSGNYHQRIHALSILTGSEEFGGPVDITATYPGHGQNSTNGNVIFDPKQYEERASLLLLNGVVYTSWTSHCDIQPYTGWMIGYDEKTLSQRAVLNFTPNGSEGALWGSGGGPTSDANGNIYAQLANGTFDAALNAQGFPSQGDYGNAFVKVVPSNGGLQIADYWTMYNTIAESSMDEDLGSGGVMLLPDLMDANGQTRHLGIGAGKDANIYVFDRDNMGKFNASNNANLYQQVSGVLAGGDFATPAWFNGTVYFGAVADSIRALPMAQARLTGSSSSQTAAAFEYPGATPSISANGISNAIVWAVENASTSVLHAYDAANLGNELYNSNQAPNARDQFGSGNKFMAPTIADGRVFVGTPNSVAVFGLLQSSPPPPVVVSTTTAISAPETTAPSGTSIPFTAQVSSGAGVPSGSVTFYDGSSALGTASLDATGGAIFATSSLAAGTHSITAGYSGGSGFAASTSSAISIAVVATAAGVTFTLNPVMAPAGVTLGQATMSWSAPQASTVEIHIGLPNGVLFAQGGSNGSATTGDWVTDGMPFFLQNVTNGNPLVAANTLAVATAHLQTQTLAGTLTIAPNPIYTPYGALGNATLTWSALSIPTVEIRVNAPNGPLLASGGSQGNATASGWVTNGMTFYLQDTSQGEILTPAYTIAKAAANVELAPEAGVLLATPNPLTLTAGQMLGSTTLNWNTSTARTVEVHVNAPDGPLFVRGGPQGTATASGWAVNGLEFFLQDVSAGQPLATQFTIATQTVSVGNAAGVSFQASPNPVIVPAGEGFGTSTFFWNAPSASTVEVHVGAPQGPLFAQGGSMGSATATGWVSDGLMFYLQDVSGGKPLVPANTLAVVQAHLLIAGQP